MNCCHVVFITTFSLSPQLLSQHLWFVHKLNDDVRKRPKKESETFPITQCLKITQKVSFHKIASEAS